MAGQGPTLPDYPRVGPCPTECQPYPGKLSIR